MGQPGSRRIEAAGGVLWRPAHGGSGVEVALVHRPKYDDWSIPKGKLNAGEHPLLAAIREVREESGFHGVPGRPLVQTHYLKDGVPKRVRYWAMRHTGGEFVPNAEVDQIMWIPPREGQRHLLAERDRPVLASFLADTAPTTPCIVVRHGSAGERGSWPGDDRDRPLDATGQAQAQALIPVLAAYEVRRVLSADVLRCLDTVGPYAAAHQITVESEPLLSETGYAANPDGALDRMRCILADGRATVVCSQGKTMPGLIARTATALGARPPADTAARKGAFWVLHAADGGSRLAGIERFDALA